MKRFAVLAALAISTFLSLQATAGPRPYIWDVSWRSSLLTIPGGVTDSSDAGAVGTAALHYDTTTAIPLFAPGGPGWIIPGEMASGPLTTASDSLAWLRISFHPLTTAPTVASDSIYLRIEASEDGITWGATTPTSVFALTSSNSDTYNGAIILEQGTGNSYTYVLRQRVGATAAGAVFFPLTSSATALTWQQLYGVPYIRLIVLSDVTGRYDAKISGFVPAD